MKNNSIKTVVAIGIGAALFVVIGLIRIPTPAPNTYIQLQYAVQALLSVIFGPLAGFLIGFIGHAVMDSLSGAPWWSWVLASGVVGLVIGSVKHKLQVSDGVFTRKDIVLFNGVQIVANILAWGLVAPVLDIVIYHEPINKLFVQGLVAGIGNALTVAIAGTILVQVYARSRIKEGSLSKNV